MTVWGVFLCRCENPDVSGDGAIHGDYGQDHTMWGLPHPQTAIYKGKVRAQLEACNERGRSGCSDLPNHTINQSPKCNAGIAS